MQKPVSMNRSKTALQPPNLGAAAPLKSTADAFSRVMTPVIRYCQHNYVPLATNSFIGPCTFQFH